MNQRRRIQRVVSWLLPVPPLEHAHLYIYTCLHTFVHTYTYACTHTHTHHRTTVVTAVVSGVTVLSIIPLAIATILAYCVTGYIRDILFHRVVKVCIGPFCSLVVRRQGLDR